LRSAIDFLRKSGSSWQPTTLTVASPARMLRMTLLAAPLPARVTRTDRSPVTRDNLVVPLAHVKAPGSHCARMNVESRRKVARRPWRHAGWMLVGMLFVLAPGRSGAGDDGPGRRWVNIGPAPIHGGQVGLRGNERPVSGRVSAVAVDPRDDRHWLVGGAQGGIWETTDAGRTWAPLTDDQVSLATGAIAFSPSSSNVVYVGTGEAIEQKGVISGFGLLKLTRQNGSAPWAAALVSDRFTGLSFSDIKVIGNGSSGDRLIVATRTNVGGDFHNTLIDFNIGDADAGVFDYPDATGQPQWQHTLRGNATDLEVHPHHPEKMYAGITYTTGNESVPGVYRRGSGPPISASGPMACLDTDGSVPPNPSPERQCTFPVVPNDPNNNPNSPWHRVSGPWDVAACQAACKDGDTKRWPDYLARTELASGGSNHPGVLYVSIARRKVRGVRNPFEWQDSHLLGLWRTNNAWDDTPEWFEVDVSATDGGSGVFGYCGAHPAAPQEPMCHWAHDIIVDPHRPEVLYAGGIALWKAEIDCASGSQETCRPTPRQPFRATWTELSQVAAGNTPTPRLRHRGIHVDQQAMTWDTAGRRLIVTNDGGVWSTVDGGRDWADHNSGLSVVQLYKGAISEPADGRPMVIIAGAQDNGIVRWDGSRWDWLLGGDGGVVAISSNRATHAAVATEGTLFGNRIRRTVDGGTEFVFADAAAGQPGEILKADPLTMPLVMCPEDDDVLLAGGNVVWRTRAFFSTPGVASWTPVPNPKLAATTTVSAIAFGPPEKSPGSKSERCGRFAVGTDMSRAPVIHLTNDAGKNWCRLVLPKLPDDEHPTSTLFKITALAFDARDPRVLYATLVDQTHDLTQFGLVAMTDRAPTTAAECANAQPDITEAWTMMRLPSMVPSSAHPCRPNLCTLGNNAVRACEAVDDGPPKRPADWREHVHTIAVHPFTSEVFVGTNAGIWSWSRKPGEGWIRHDCAVGMPNVPVFDIKISPKSGQVVAFTYGRGAFVLQDRTWCDGKASNILGSNFISCDRRLPPSANELSGP